MTGGAAAAAAAAALLAALGGASPQPPAPAPAGDASPAAPASPAPPAAPAAPDKPPLPPVPQTTPPDTGPEVSPATPGVNLDPPPPGSPAGDPDAVAAAPLADLGPDALTLDQADALSVDVERRIVAEGNVVLRFRGYRIRADRATFDSSRLLATFAGNVVIEGEPQNVPQTFQLDTLTLDTRTREFTSANGRTVVPVELLAPTLVQPLRLSGKTLAREGRDLVALDGLLTTCDYPDPHYHIGFRRATVIPNRRIALRDVTLFDGRNRKLLRIPYLAVPITDRVPRYNYLPQVGQNNEEGVFVKSVVGYLLRDDLPGLLRVDLMQKKGVGLGVDQAYQLGAAAAGTLVLYGLRDQSRGVGNLSGQLSHQQRFGANFTASLSSTFQQNSYNAVNAGSKTQYTTLTATRTAGGTGTTASLSLSRSQFGLSGASETATYAVTQTQRFGQSGNVRLALNGSRFQTPSLGGAAGATTRQDQTGDLRANTRLGAFDVELAANKNLAGGSAGGGFFGGTERLPEIIVSTDTARFAPANGFFRKVPLRIQAGVGRFVESGFDFSGGGTGAPRRTETERALLAVDATPQPIPIAGPNLSLQLAGTLRQTVYGAGDAAQYVLGGRSQLTRRLGGTSSLNLTYGYQRPYGAPPLGFRLDESGSFNNLGANLAVNGSRVRLALFTGYDIQRARLDRDALFGAPRNPWQNLAIQLGLRPSGVFQTRFTGSYDINSGRLRDLTNRVRVRVPGGVALDTGLRYDPRTGKFSQINALLESPLWGGLWNVYALAGYNGFTRRFEYKNFALTRAYHDYEVTFTYVDQPFGFRSEKGFNLSIRLKAFPFLQRTGVGQYGTALDTGTGEVF